MTISSRIRWPPISSIDPTLHLPILLFAKIRVTQSKSTQYKWLQSNGIPFFNYSIYHQRLIHTYTFRGNSLVNLSTGTQDADSTLDSRCPSSVESNGELCSDLITGPKLRPQIDQRAGHLRRETADLNPVFSEEGTIISSSMTDSSSDSCYFQNKIHLLTELTHAQPKAVTKQRRQPHTGQAEQYLHYLDDIATLITVKVDNGQDAAATCFRSPKHIRILWTLGGNATRFHSHLAAQAVDSYLNEICRQVFECDDLQEVLWFVISECKPTVLRYFQEIMRCMARNSSGPARARMPRSTKVRGWNEELQMLIHETDHYVVKGICSSAMKDEHAANYDLFVQKISNVDEGTSCCELAGLLIYCYFLTKSFGMTAPISKGLWTSLKDAGRLWSACKDLRQYVVFARRRYRELSVEFQHVSYISSPICLR